MIAGTALQQQAPRRLLRLAIVPMSFSEANAYVERHHRHLGRTQGMKFALGAALGDDLVGVAIVARPVAPALDDGWTVEAVRVCTNGTRNACSFLNRASWRAARALGYRRLVTYTEKTESGASLRGAGFVVVAEVRAQSWNRPGRPRDPGDPQERLRWEPAG